MDQQTTENVPSQVETQGPPKQKPADLAELTFTYSCSPDTSERGTHKVIYRLISPNNGETVEEKTIDIGNTGQFTVSAPVGYYLMLGIFYEQDGMQSRMRQWDDLVPNKMPPLGPGYDSGALNMQGISLLKPVDLTVTPGEGEGDEDDDVSPAEATAEEAA